MESIFMFFIMSIFILMSVCSFCVLYSLFKDYKEDPSDIRWAIFALAIVFIMGIYGLIILGYIGG